jgi:hypothetical protein
MASNTQKYKWPVIRFMAVPAPRLIHRCAARGHPSLGRHAIGGSWGGLSISALRCTIVDNRWCRLTGKALVEDFTSECP